MANERLAEMRAVHVKSSVGPECVGCDYDARWPCDTAWLLARLDAAERDVRELERVAIVACLTHQGGTLPDVDECWQCLKERAGRLDAAERALERYGWHAAGCGRFADSDETCTCGYDALTRPPAAPEGT